VSPPVPVATARLFTMTTPPATAGDEKKISSGVLGPVAAGSSPLP
jgi:hypothetical protein